MKGIAKVDMMQDDVESLGPSQRMAFPRDDFSFYSTYGLVMPVRTFVR